MSVCQDLRLFNRIGQRTKHTIEIDVESFPSGSIDNFNMYWSCRRTLTSPNAAIALNNIDNPYQVEIDAVNNIVYLTLGSNDTNNLYSGAYYWDITAIGTSTQDNIVYPSTAYGDIILQPSLFSFSTGSGSVVPITYDLFVLADTSSGNFTYTLPAAPTWTGREFFVKADSLASGSVIVYPYSGETIDGQSSFEIDTPEGSATFYSNGTNIYVIATI